jgi:hypothetical protein
MGGELYIDAGALHFNISRSFDYRGRPRQVFVKQGVVAADHGRCSEIGLARSWRPLWLDNAAFNDSPAQ